MTIYFSTNDVLKDVYREYRRQGFPPITELMLDGEPPPEALLPAAPGVPFGTPGVFPGEHDTVPRGRRLARSERLPIGYRPKLQLTQLRPARVESMRARKARFLREANVELEAYLA